MKNWIQIWYSWGAQAAPVAVPEGTDPWEFLKELVINEVDACQEEFPYGCGVWMYPDEKRAVLKYYKDNQHCYYLITDTEDFNPDGRNYYPEEES